MKFASSSFYVSLPFFLFVLFQELTMLYIFHLIAQDISLGILFSACFLYLKFLGVLLSFMLSSCHFSPDVFFVMLFCLSFTRRVLLFSRLDGDS